MSGQVPRFALKLRLSKVMLAFLREHIQTVDPVHENRVLVAQFAVLLLIALFFYAYLQPQQAIFLLLGVIVGSLIGFFYYTMREKILVKILALVVFSIVIMMYSIFNQWGIILAPLTFFLVFGLMLISYFGPNFRIVICLAYLNAAPSLFFNTGWVSGVNSIIDFSIVIFFSVIVDYLFIPVRRHFLNNAAFSAGEFFLKRIRLCRTALLQNSQIPEQKMHEYLGQELLIRNKLVLFGNLTKKFPTLFYHQFFRTDLGLNTIAVRQSVYSLLLAVDDIVRKPVTNAKPLLLELDYIERLIGEWLNIIKPDAIKLPVINDQITIAQENSWVIEQFLLRAAYLKNDLQQLISSYESVAHD